ncbi:sigma-54-dependent Fis family transcriptional regulator [Sporolituus thermophilus]|uniref:Transcriptional regulator containing PAS, AAA-type ATPase, and DNA-binding Fis domains n=1 Tax=Sporolituus thermophilus DSM 23256 TaxID=1123285 RepID=A0A1G7MGD3_9FIRM|nr:sigma 54-interacting transcriptional regulator [Sporolituus thermophilus]SDF60908.1 Transcriptional regulator containing PAS, AAA-type ATPase, and DNA-binding Fis domains [Sporolituus thermophilus DSM 23256]
MIRERRSKEKLQNYYYKFVKHGELDPNVHPWVAESWQRSRAAGVPTDRMPPLKKLDKQELARRRERHRVALAYLDGLFREIREHFNVYNLSLLLLDQECYALKSYALPFFQMTPGELEGARLTEADIGTSSISIAYRHQTPFLLFGPEMWIAECQTGDACSTPVMPEGEPEYVLTLVSVQQEEIPYGAVMSLLLTMKYALENYLRLERRLAVKRTILDAVPLAVYHILPGGEVAYTNRLGQNRLSVITPEGQAGEPPNLSDVVLNYRHTPLYKGFLGIPSYNKEVTWITPQKTYEDITTVVPIERDGQVASVVAVSMPIEDLRTMVAHAAGYTARYSLASIVGEAPAIVALKDKATRVARGHGHLLLQGEPGTGKQRLAHGIHQASHRAAGPLIAVRCADMPPDLLEAELFGTKAGGDESRPGKLELANGGTLFLDEVEKLPPHLQARLAQALTAGQAARVGEDVLRSFDVRVIAACDSDLKRLTEKGAFLPQLHELLAKTVLRIPPLRARAGDIPLLAAHIIDELAQQHNLPVKQLSEAAAELLMSYDWPGNIKQLQGVVEHAFFHTAGQTITPGDIILPGEVGPSKAWKEDREVFIEAWKAAGGNISRLANMLDVSRVTLYRYLKKYGLERQ